jgi:hypothetical protein
MKITRRQLLGSAALAGATSANPPQGPRRRMRSLDGSGKVWDIWRTAGRFTKNPDIIRFPLGRMMLVFCDDDQH